MVSRCGVDANGLAVWFCKPTTSLQSNTKHSKAYKLYRLLAVCKNYGMSSGTIRIKIYGKYRDVWVADTENCKNYKCFHPHDCPVQGARGVRSSKERYMCLTNVHHGCPDEPQKQ